MTGLALSSYVAVVSTRFRTLLQYRTAAIAGIATQIFWGFVKLMVLGAFYAVLTEPPPMSFESIVAYVWFGQCLFALFPINVDPELRGMFRTGSVAYELLRPLNLYAFWSARTLAFRTAPTLLRSVPGLIFAFLILRLLGLDDWVMPPPASILSFVGFSISLVVAIALSCAILMILNISMFWFMDARGTVALATSFVWVLSGMIIPIPLFPDWAQNILYWQPFRGLCDIPFRIYSGDIPATSMIAEISLQACWTLVILAIGLGLERKARRKLTVQGG